MILPTPSEVRRARIEANLTQQQAARLVHVSVTAWQRWEALISSANYRQINGAAWELFLLRTHRLRPENSKFRVRKAKMA